VFTRTARATALRVVQIDDAKAGLLPDAVVREADGDGTAVFVEQGHVSDEEAKLGKAARQLHLPNPLEHVPAGDRSVAEHGLEAKLDRLGPDLGLGGNDGTFLVNSVRRVLPLFRRRATYIAVGSAATAERKHATAERADGPSPSSNL
jgi:hypothetical protein